jgi:hypothetical protein
MKIKVNGNNVRKFYTSLWGNLEQEKDAQFCINIKKLSLAVHSDKWTNGQLEGNMSIDIKNYIKSHVIDFVNPIILEDKNTKKDVELDKAILFSDTYEELYPLVEELLTFIQKMYEEDNDEDVKK